MPGRSPSTKPLSGAYSIRAHLIVFALALVLPIIGFAGFLVWRGAQAEQAQVAEDASRVAALAAIAIDRELTGMLATLQALETSPSLESGDLGAFHRQASSALRVLGAHIIAARHERPPAGQHARPLGHRSRRRAAADWNLAQLSRPHVSDFTREAVTGEPIVTVSVPVLEGDTVTHVLAMSVPAIHWRGVLAENVVRPDWSGGLIDRKNVFIARLRGHEQFVGRPSPDDLRTVTAREGVLTRTNADGEPVLFAYRRSAFAGLARRDRRPDRGRAGAGAPLAPVRPGVGPRPARPVGPDGDRLRNPHRAAAAAPLGLGGRPRAGRARESPRNRAARSERGGDEPLRRVDRPARAKRGVAQERGALPPGDGGVPGRRVRLRCGRQPLRADPAPLRDAGRAPGRDPDPEGGLARPHPPGGSPDLRGGPPDDVRARRAAIRGGVPGPASQRILDLGLAPGAGAPGRARGPCGGWWARFSTSRRGAMRRSI